MLNSIRITVSLSQNIIVNFLTVWKLRNWTNLNVKVCMYIAYIRWLKIIWKVFRLFLGKYIAKIYYFFFSKTLEKNRRIVKRKVKYLIHGYIIIVFLSFSLTTCTARSRFLRHERRVRVLRLLKIEIIF